VWVVYGIAMLIAGMYLRNRPVRVMAMLLLGLVILKTFLYDVWTIEKVYRVIAFIGLGVALLVASYIYQAHRERIRQLIGGEESNAE